MFASRPALLIALALLTPAITVALSEGCVESGPPLCSGSCRDGAAGDRGQDRGVVDRLSPDQAHGLHAAIGEQALALPDLSGCNPPNEDDIKAPVQPFPAEPLPGPPLMVGGGGAFSTLAQALASAQDGSGILVRSDVTGEVVIDKRVIVTGEGATISGTVVLKAPATLQGFVIIAGAANAITVAADDCKVLNNRVEGFTKAGILVEGTKRALVGGNAIIGGLTCAQNTDCGDRGIAVSDAEDVVLADNLIYHCSVGIQLKPVSSGKNGCTGCAVFRNKLDQTTFNELFAEGLTGGTIRGNRLEYSGYTPGSPGVNGIDLRLSNGVVIDRNYVGCHYYGIQVRSGEKLTVSNNVSDGSGVPVRFGYKEKNDPATESAGPGILVRKNRVTDGVDNILAEMSQGISFECNEVYKTTDYKQSWPVSNGIYTQSGGPYAIKDNNLHDLINGVRLGKEAHDVTVGNNSFCRNSSKNILDEGCTNCSVNPGTQCP